MCYADARSQRNLIQILQKLTYPIWGSLADEKRLLLKKQEAGHGRIHEAGKGKKELLTSSENVREAGC